MMLKIAPAYTIAKADPEKHIKPPLPGPFDYSPHDQNSRPAYSFGKSRRDLHNINKTPGPGRYYPILEDQHTINSTLKAPKSLLNIKSGLTEDTHLYESSSNRYNISVHNARSLGKLSLIKPGPGDYFPNIAASFKASPRVFFPKQSRMPPNPDMTPAPGQYNISIAQNSPRFSFPKAVPKKINNSPGPGHYQIPMSTLGLASLKRL